MTEEQFRAEKMYYISLSIAKSMLEKGVIDKEILTIIDTKLLEKYRPISGMLLAGKPLA
ncbi:SHOCT domain-containing protein [Parablautia muri]|uniref:SHOCT domain-containing protein n=1 Tax=Parablautia muri TaxID=2320879 RepID=UPI00136C1058|nr:SHOCT domain-containing protein [Parablautia muri]